MTSRTLGPNCETHCRASKGALENGQKIEMMYKSPRANVGDSGDRVKQMEAKRLEDGIQT
jgi:hypothetical protein